eukprot:TRINITY_DN6889_c0_g6_i1.p3 TRINITY_DN6889_c0_g6~~TRINITY_DN6889_c0_g6_i1.p3  ORF type:complete len:116 (-),score=4.14 TRINITY_DN6889_c0_g6_i1:456-803(-)
MRMRWVVSGKLTRQWFGNCRWFRTPPPSVSPSAENTSSRASSSTAPFSHASDGPSYSRPSAETLVPSGRSSISGPTISSFSMLAVLQPPASPKIAMVWRSLGSAAGPPFGTAHSA